MRKLSRRLPTQAEIVYLAELMRDFPTGEGTEPAEALLEIQSRYQTVEQILDELVKRIRRDRLPLNQYFSSLSCALHSFLFNGILSNAGMFRQATEPNGGYVGFGRVEVRNPSVAQFDGVPAEKIPREIANAASNLSWRDAEPVSNSIVFYQKFVRVHPFYDANGRIARALVSLYLRLNGWHVLWKELETTKKNRFIKKLNACHKRERDAVKLAEYRSFLVSFWTQFVVPIKEIHGGSFDEE